MPCVRANKKIVYCHGCNLELRRFSYTIICILSYHIFPPFASGNFHKLVPPSGGCHARGIPSQILELFSETPCILLRNVL